MAMVQRQDRPSRPLCVEQPRLQRLQALSVSFAPLQDPEQRAPPPPGGRRLLGQDQEVLLQVGLGRRLAPHQPRQPEDRACDPLHVVAPDHDREHLFGPTPPPTVTASL